MSNTGERTQQQSQSKKHKIIEGGWPELKAIFVASMVGQSEQCVCSE